jgi:hypothetical protein
VWVAWREGALTRAEELEAFCDWEMAKTNATQGYDQVLVKAIQRHLKAARQAATKDALDPNRRLVLVRRIFRNGPLIERAQSNLDAAEAQLLNLAPARYILGQMPCLVRHVQCHLPSTDPARQEFERIARRLGINDPDRPLPQNSDDQDLKDKENKDTAVHTPCRSAGPERTQQCPQLRKPSTQPESSVRPTVTPTSSRPTGQDGRKTMAISNFATEVLADGPIGYWRLGEAIASVTADDASGNGNSEVRRYQRGSCVFLYCDDGQGVAPWGHRR